MNNSQVLGVVTNDPLDLPIAIESNSLPEMVTMTSDEVYGRCPITGQPDFYTVEVAFQPNKLILESKSLKLYLQKFASHNHPGAFCEALAHDIADEIMGVLKARFLQVQVIQKPRGGITIRAEAYRETAVGGAG